jgi:transcriptional regulator with XRE-family HTH domain
MATLRERIESRGLTQSVICVLAGVFDSDLSRVLRNLHISKTRVERIEKTVCEIEAMLESGLVCPPPNLRNADSVRDALQVYSDKLRSARHRTKTVARGAATGAAAYLSKEGRAELQTILGADDSCVSLEGIGC